jgi:hypothetical protein
MPQSQSQAEPDEQSVEEFDKLSGVVYMNIVDGIKLTLWDEPRDGCVQVKWDILNGVLNLVPVHP